MICRMFRIRYTMGPDTLCDRSAADAGRIALRQYTRMFRVHCTLEPVRAMT